MILSTTTLNLKHLKLALDSLYYAKSNPVIYKNFESLHLVKRRMDAVCDIGVNRTALREYVVQELLCDLIEKHLQEQRQTLAIPHRPAKYVQTSKQALEIIERDASSHSPILMGWSLLYHVHLRPDLNISHAQFAEIAHINPRTAQRYKNQVLGLMLQHIIQLEIDCKTSV